MPKVLNYQTITRGIFSINLLTAPYQRYALFFRSSLVRIVKELAPEPIAIVFARSKASTRQTDHINIPIIFFFSEMSRCASCILFR